MFVTKKSDTKSETIQKNSKSQPGWGLDVVIYIAWGVWNRISLKKSDTSRGADWLILRVGSGVIFVWCWFFLTPRWTDTALQPSKIFRRVLVPLANNPTLGVHCSNAVAAGYKKQCFLTVLALFTVQKKYFKVTKPPSKKNQQNDVYAFTNFAYPPRTCTAV